MPGSSFKSCGYLTRAEGLGRVGRFLYENGFSTTLSTVVYPSTQNHSPISGSVVSRLREILAKNPTSTAARYIKIGDSNTNRHDPAITTNEFMRPFSSTYNEYDLDAFSSLQSTVTFFDVSHDKFEETARCGSTIQYPLGAGQTCAGTTPAVGPYPMDLALINNPRYAVIMHGTNGPEGFPGWEDQYRMVVERLMVNGVIPILNTIPFHASANQRSVVFNPIIRRVAQDYLLPFIDVFLAVNVLPSQGTNDGIHFSIAGTGPGDLTPTGLLGGWNMRNLLTLQSLQRVKDALDNGTVFA